MSSAGYSDSTTSHYTHDELPLVALQLLPRSEHGAAIAHIADCPNCRLELATVQGDLAAYAHTVELHSPPAFVRERILNRLPREKRTLPPEAEPTVAAELPAAQFTALPPYGEQAASSLQQEAAAPLPEISAAPALSESEEESIPLANYGRDSRAGDRLNGREETIGRAAPPGLLRRVRADIFGWSAWAAAGAFAAVTGNLYHRVQSQRVTIAAQAAELDRRNTDVDAARRLLDTITDATARRITLSPALDGPIVTIPLARVIYSARTGSLVLLATNLEPLDDGKTYQLWLIPGGGHDPIPSGAFRPDSRGNASIILPQIPKGVEARSFGVTVEDATGAQVPNMPMVLAGN